MEHNYLKKLAAMMQAGEIPEGASVTECHILHDLGCGLFRHERCDCDPHIELKEAWSYGQNKSSLSREDWE